MKITKELSLSNFDFWCTDLPDYLTEEEFEIIERELSYEYPEGLDATELNDLFRFETDYIVNLIGYSNHEKFLEERD